jgi:hypothetical protein
LTAAQFDVLLERRLALTKKVLGAKAVEYASEKDRLHNFKQAAAFMRGTPQQALLGFMAKHLVSIVDMIEDHAVAKEVLPGQIDEKIGDAVNYLILLEALFKDTTF